MPKSTKSRNRGTSQGRSKLIDAENDGDLLSPEEWITFAAKHPLSQRELSVLVLTCEGASRKAIARKLRRSLKTVNTYCERLHQKLKVKDRVGQVCQLLRFVRRLYSK